ncbi:hypothetical protein ElyMa_003033200 [Elysia marginata]|uniref:Uncharacterized protein n=1 Tax=Elysia marginata TaxID=1093978 RepID=A0AAV4IJ92_9GAST|nr:hypothetical protein ElyMa_003033200 [Elysia marginata]
MLLPCFTPRCVSRRECQRTGKRAVWFPSKETCHLATTGIMLLSIWTWNFFRKTKECPPGGTGLLAFAYNLPHGGRLDNKAVYCRPKDMRPVDFGETFAGPPETLMKQLEDLDFSDDISLLSHKQQDAQGMLSRMGNIRGS